MWGFLRAFDKKLQELDQNYKYTFYCFSGDYGYLFTSHSVCKCNRIVFQSPCHDITN